MEQVNISLLKARVGHSRLRPVKNKFLYEVFYLKIPIQKKATYKTPLLFSFNHWNIFSLYAKDEGLKNLDVTWYSFITNELKKANIFYKKTDRIFLICHPRVLGFAFNPISYWLLVDKENNLKAVLCEVHNTFSQTHNYLLSKRNNEPIVPSDILISDKKLYVSPFNTMEGHYEFQFIHHSKYFKSDIRYFDLEGKDILHTFMDGSFSALTNQKIIFSLVLYPLMTIQVVLRIHWQALRLFLKKLPSTLNSKPKYYINNQTTISKKIKQ